MESEIARAFRRWEALRAEPAAEDDESDMIAAIEATIAALAPSTIEDFAKQLVVWTMYGRDVNGTHIDEAMVARLLALAGVSRPSHGAS